MICTVNGSLLTARCSRSKHRERYAERWRAVQHHAISHSPSLPRLVHSRRRWYYLFLTVHFVWSLLGIASPVPCIVRWSALASCCEGVRLRVCMSTVVVAMSTVAVISLMYVVYLSVVYFCMFLYITATRLSGIFMLQLQVFFFFFCHQPS